MARFRRHYQQVQGTNPRTGTYKCDVGPWDYTSVAYSYYILLVWVAYSALLLSRSLTLVLYRSPALLPKPKDWSNNIDISGFLFLSSGSRYKPPEALAEFLDSGPPPVYIGFGSIVIDQPDLMTNLIFEAIKKIDQRAIISQGWGGLNAEEIGLPDNVLMIGSCPHDWLFKRVSCVVHHGGAGTTAAGLSCQKPTVIVPFFGDQPFWGSIVSKAGAGPPPIPHKQLTADKLVAAIRCALEPETRQRAEELGAKINQENGLDAGVESFHRQLRTDTVRCMMCPSRTAVWRVRRTKIRLSALAATTLSHEGILDLHNLKRCVSQKFQFPRKINTIANVCIDIVRESSTWSRVLATR